MNLKLFGFALAGVATIALTACGGGGGGGKAVDAEDWVKDVCDIAVDFDGEADDLFAGLDPADNNAKEDIIAAYEDAVDLQGDLLSDFEDLGYPDVDGGKEIRDVMKEDIETTRSSIEDLISALEDIDEDDFEDDFFDALDDVEETDLREEIEDVDGDGDEIIDLVDEDGDCSAILFN